MHWTWCLRPFCGLSPRPHGAMSPEHERTDAATVFPKDTPPPRGYKTPKSPAFTKGPYTSPCLHIAPKATVHCPASFRGMRAIDSTSGSFQRGCCLYRRPSILSLLTEFSRPLLLRDTQVWMYRSDTRAVSVPCGPLSPSPRPLPLSAPHCRLSQAGGRATLPTRVEVGSGQARHCAD